MHSQEGDHAPSRASGMGLGLGIGVAVGVGGVFTLGAVGIVAFAVLRGPAKTRASGAMPSTTVAGAQPTTPSQPVASSVASLPPVGATLPDTSAKHVSSLAADTLYTRTAPAVVRIEVRDDKFRGVSQGTGFFVSSDGLLVTNHHVIDGGAFATVETAEGATLFVEGVAAVDKVQDLALLKVKAAGLGCLVLSGAERPPVGTRVFAIGHPRGVKNSTLSEGLVSSVGVALGGDVPSIQTTAPVSPGSSGGPLLTADGRVVGVIAAGRDDAQNLNFAVPVSLVHDLMSRGKAAPLKPMASAGGASLDRQQAAVLRKAIAAIDRRDLREAASILAEARPRLQGSNTYWVMAGALNMELRNYSAAAEAYQNAVRLKADSVESQEMLGLALWSQEKYREAGKAFDAASKLAPKNSKYYYYAGRCYMEQNQPDRAVSLYKKAMQLSPNDAAYTARLGDAYFKMNQHADAMMAYEKSIKINPNEAETHVSLAEALISLRRTDDAVEPLRKALSLNPSHARAHLQTGVLQLERKQVMAALLSFQSAARLDPGGKVGQTATAAISVIQASIQQEQARQQQQQEQQQAQQQQQLPRQPQRRR